MSTSSLINTLMPTNEPSTPPLLKIILGMSFPLTINGILGRLRQRLIAATIIRERLEQLPLAFPEIAKEDNAKLKAAAKELKKEAKH